MGLGYSSPHMGSNRLGLLRVLVRVRSSKVLPRVFGIGFRTQELRLRNRCCALGPGDGEREIVLQPDQAGIGPGLAERVFTVLPTYLIYVPQSSHHMHAITTF